MTRQRVRVVIFALALTLAGCAGVPAPIETPVGDPVDFTAVDGAWRISGGGDWVEGETTICSTAESILIEDAEALASPDGAPVPTMVLMDGAVGYGTSWIGSTTPTGPSEGSGTYVVAGEGGVPQRIVGSATLTWYDADADTYENRVDEFAFDLEPVDTPDYCVG